MPTFMPASRHALASPSPSPPAPAVMNAVLPRKFCISSRTYLRLEVNARCCPPRASARNTSSSLLQTSDLDPVLSLRTREGNEEIERFRTRHRSPIRCPLSRHAHQNAPYRHRELLARERRESSVDQPEPARLVRCEGSLVDAQLFVALVQVPFHRRFGHSETGPDVLVSPALRGEPQHLDLPRAERRRADDF